MSSDSGAGFLGRFKARVRQRIVEEWPAISRHHGGAVILGLMVSGLFWGVFGGLKLWVTGQPLSRPGALLGIPEQLESPLLHRMSDHETSPCDRRLHRGTPVAPVPVQPSAEAGNIFGRLGGTFMASVRRSPAAHHRRFFTPHLHACRPAGRCGPG